MPRVQYFVWYYMLEERMSIRDRVAASLLLAWMPQCFADFAKTWLAYCGGV